jgi:hypothetical protein
MQYTGRLQAQLRRIVQRSMNCLYFGTVLPSFAAHVAPLTPLPTRQSVFYAQILKRIRLFFYLSSLHFAQYSSLSSPLAPWFIR